MGAKLLGETRHRPDQRRERRKKHCEIEQDEQNAGCHACSTGPRDLRISVEADLSAAKHACLPDAIKILSGTGPA
jgi:hypothetical protein